MPESIAAPVANYAHAVLAERAERTLYTSGVVPVSVDGSVVEGIGAQAEVVWSNIVAVLDEAGLTVADIVSITTYVVVGQPLAEVMAARDRALAGHLAASTLLPVPALARPEWLLEIAIIASR